MQEIQLVVVNEVGLHLRPLKMFIETTNEFESEIQVRNVTKSSDWANGKSILNMLALAVEQNNEIELRIEGLDEAAAAKAIKEVVESDFKE